MTANVTIVKFFGSYIRVYASQDLITPQEQLKIFDFQRNYAARFFEELATKYDHKEAKINPSQPPAHPAAVALHQVVSLLNDVSDQILTRFVPAKQLAKYGAEFLGFFTGWPHADDLCKSMKLDVAQFADAVGFDGVVASKKDRLANRRAKWVLLLHELDCRFGRSASYMLQTDFTRMYDVLYGATTNDEEHGQDDKDPEKVFAYFVRSVHARIEYLQAVLQRVVVSNELK